MNQTSPMNTATAAGAAAVVAPLVSWIASLFRVALPPEVLGSIVVLLVAGAHWVSQFAADRYASKAAANATTQGGFASIRLLGVVAAIALALSLFGCASAPTASEVQQIKIACAMDAGVRPTVSVLLAIPGLANPAEAAAVDAARKVIDPICANPEGSPQDNALAALSGATATIAGIAEQLQARKAK